MVTPQAQLEAEPPMPSCASEPCGHQVEVMGAAEVASSSHYGQDLLCGPVHMVSS